MLGQETYEDDDKVMEDTTRIIAQDFVTLLNTGYELPCGSRLKIAITGVKGDWPFLIEAGNLSRNFRHQPKRGHTNPGANSGICHLCLAGLHGYPYSDLGPNARWELTMSSLAATSPWDVESPFTELLPQNPALPNHMYKPDIWHNWHLGLGRYFLSSSLIVLAPLFEGDSIPARFQSMTAAWRAYSRSRKKRPLLRKITRDTLNYHGPLDWPEGGWQKADTTTLLCEPCLQ